MSATEIAIRTHDELSIEPECLIGREYIWRDYAETDRRGREFAVFKMGSRSEPGITRTVVCNDKTRQLYCDCPAAQRGLKCRHAKSVLFLRIYNETYRLYHTATLPELQERERDFIETERGTLVPVRGWMAQWAAIGDLVLERTQRAA